MGERAAGGLEQRMVSQPVALAAERMRKKVAKVSRRNLKTSSGLWGPH